MGNDSRRAVTLDTPKTFNSRYAISLAADPFVSLFGKATTKTPCVEPSMIVHRILETTEGRCPWIVSC